MDELYQVLKEDGTLAPGRSAAEVPATELILKMYRTMVIARVTDDRSMVLQRQGRIGFYVPAVGQEAAQIGSAAATTADDWVFPAYRELGVALWRGVTLRVLFDQFIGTSADIIKGRQMPNHYGYRQWRIMSPSSPIATQIPHAVGFAMAAKIRREPIVTIAYFGDGATSEGDFHVAMNFAGVYKAPTVFFCQNNQYAISLPVHQQTASSTIDIKAVAYGIDHVRVDGNDLLACHAMTKKAVRKAREGGGPFLIEAVTYRMGPHSTADDPKRYRSEAEVEEWRRKDPLVRVRKYLEANGLWSTAEEEAFQKQVNDDVVAAFKAAEAVAMPDPVTIFDDVFAEVPWHLQEQRSELLEEIRVHGAPRGHGAGGHAK